MTRLIDAELAAARQRDAREQSPALVLDLVGCDAALSHLRDAGYTGEAVPDFDKAIRIAQSQPGTMLVAGSFHTVGDAMARLQVDPLAG